MSKFILVTDSPVHDSASSMIVDIDLVYSANSPEEKLVYEQMITAIKSAITDGIVHNTAIGVAVLSFLPTNFPYEQIPFMGTIDAQVILYTGE